MGSRTSSPHHEALRMRIYYIPSRNHLLVCGEYVIENEMLYIQSENMNICHKKIKDGGAQGHLECYLFKP
jgi:hypothetical protein